MAQRAGELGPGSSGIATIAPPQALAPPCGKLHWPSNATRATGTSQAEEMEINLNVQTEVKVVDNGVNVEALLGASGALAERPCDWVDGVHSRSTVEGFFGLGEEQARKAPSTLTTPSRLKSSSPLWRAASLKVSHPLRRTRHPAPPCRRGRNDRAGSTSPRCSEARARPAP